MSEWNTPKAPKWAENLPGPAIKKLGFIARNPVIFGSNVIPEIKTITFLDHLPDMKGTSFNLSQGKKHSVSACLTKDKKNLYIGADGGINAADSCSHMFEGLDHVEQIVFTWDSFHTDLTTGFSCMFKDCKSLKSLNVTSFRTSNAISFYEMFCGCKNLESLELGNFRIHKGVKWGKLFDKNCNAYWFRASPDIDGMFSGCESLTFLDLSSFDTTRVVDFSRMFENCKNLKTLRLSREFVIRSDAKTDNMFTGCVSLDENVLPNAR